MSKYRKVLAESVTITSTKLGLPTIQHVSTNKENVVLLLLKGIVGEDGIHKKHLHLKVLIVVFFVCSFLYIVSNFSKH